MPEFTGIHSGVGDGYLLVPGSPRATLVKLELAKHNVHGFAKLELLHGEEVWVNPGSVLFLSDETVDDA